MVELLTESGFDPDGPLAVIVCQPTGPECECGRVHAIAQMLMSADAFTDVADLADVLRLHADKLVARQGEINFQSHQVRESHS